MKKFIIKYTYGSKYSGGKPTLNRENYLVIRARNYMHAMKIFKADIDNIIYGRVVLDIWEDEEISNSADHEKLQKLNAS